MPRRLRSSLSTLVEDFKYGPFNRGFENGYFRTSFQRVCSFQPKDKLENKFRAGQSDRTILQRWKSQSGSRWDTRHHPRRTRSHHPLPSKSRYPPHTRRTLPSTAHLIKQGHRINNNALHCSLRRTPHNMFSLAHHAHILSSHGHATALSKTA